MRLLLALLVLAAALGACRASDPPSAPARNPLEERAASATPVPLTSATEMSSVPPAMGGPGSVADPEGAAGHAIEFLAQALGIPATELRLVGVIPQTWPNACRGLVIPGRPCEPRQTSGWSVTLRDGLDGLHTANVSVDGTSWVPQATETGTVVSRDGIILPREATQILVIDVGGVPRKLRKWSESASGIAGTPPPGAPVAFGYDPSPRGDGIPVLTWIVATP
jgi:hypothetical protein